MGAGDGFPLKSMGRSRVAGVPGRVSQTVKYFWLSLTS